MKVKIATDIMAAIEQLRSELPPGVRLITTFPRHNDEGSMLFEIVVRIPAAETVRSDGSVQRRKRGSGK